MKADNPQENKGSFYISPKLFVALLALLHAAVALPLAYFLNIWMDEASSLYTTQHGFFAAFQNVFADEKQAPLYFLILSLWRAIDPSIFFARIFSILCSLLAIKFFYDLARKLYGESAAAAKFVSALFAIHPYLISTSVEIRGYSLVILLSILLLKFFTEGYLEERKSTLRNVPNPAQIIYVLTAICALYTNYYLGFLLVGGFIALLVLRRFQTARSYFLQMLIIGVVFLPLLLIVKQQFAASAGGFIEERTMSSGIEILGSRVLSFAFPMELSPESTLSVISIIRICFVVFGLATVIFLLVKNRFRAAGEKVLTLGTIVAVTCIFLLASYLLLGAQYVAARHFAILFAPFVLFAGLILTNVLSTRFLIFFAIGFALLFPYSRIYKQYPAFAKQGDWARVAQFIEQNEKPNQPIIVFQNYDALSLPYHYKGVNRVLPDENFFAWNLENERSSATAFQKQIDFVISEIPPDAPEIWLATEEVCQNKETAAACRPLENFIEAHYTIELEKDFYLERVRLLRKKP